MARLYSSGHQNYKDSHPDPYPVWALRRVDKPTTVIEESQISRWDEREGGFHRAGRFLGLWKAKTRLEVVA